MTPVDWLPDDELTVEQRQALREWATPRRGLDGRLWWPGDELGDGEDAP